MSNFLNVSSTSNFVKQAVLVCQQTIRFDKSSPEENCRYNIGLWVLFSILAELVLISSNHLYFN